MPWLPAATLAAVATLGAVAAAAAFARRHALPPRTAASLVAGCLGAGLFLVAFGAVADGGGLAPGDAAAAQWARAHATPGVVAAMEAVRVAGSFAVAGPVLLGVAYVLWRRWRPGAAALVVAAVLAEGGVSLLKAAIGRARPDDALSVASGLSFPSGHATLAALLAFFALWLLAEAPRPRWAWAVAVPLAAGWVVLVAASRLLLGVHYLSDVVAGAGLGLAIGGLSTSLPAAVRAHRRGRRA